MKLTDLAPKRLIPFFLATTLIPLVVVGTVLIALLFRDLTAQSRAEGQQILDHAQREITHQVGLWKNITRMAAAEEPAEALFSNLLVQFPDIQSIRYIDSTGAVRLSKTRFGVIRTSPIDLTVVKLRRLWQGPVQIIDEGEPRIPIAAVAGASILAFDFQVSSLKETLSQFQQTISLAEENSVILRSRPDGLEKVVSQRFIPDFGWTLKLYRSWFSIYRPAIRLLIQILAAILIVGLLAVFIGWGISREVEASIAHRERLSTIGQMAAVISHEMKTALAVIRNSLEFLRERSDSSDPKSLRHLEIIDAQVKTSNQILSDILVFSKNAPLQPEPCDINALAAEILDSLPVPEGVAVARHFSPTLPQVAIEPTQFKQVVVNLVQNALQAIVEGGKITVDTNHDGDQVIFRVSDTGCGIEPEHKNKIFEPFFTTKSQGTGLGLAIVKRIVDQHKGHIEIDSRPNNGTTITIKFRHMPTPPWQQPMEALT